MNSYFLYANLVLIKEYINYQKKIQICKIREYICIDEKSITFLQYIFFN